MQGSAALALQGPGSRGPLRASVTAGLMAQSGGGRFKGKALEAEPRPTKQCTWLWKRLPIIMMGASGHASPLLGGMLARDSQLSLPTDPQRRRTRALSLPPGSRQPRDSSSQPAQRSAARDSSLSLPTEPQRDSSSACPQIRSRADSSLSDCPQIRSA
ncbi:hypothetical protein CYMTET_22533 [Cymbomonas tetramitiformis]|uniref:Uncharacterized protein n=1 Tax=Cymbomonas tetramitiformis TaxID=36881 RepID=A0AAE0G0J7_9CHLO|nr:hypothetical protein CYMTET_22533 [Cymbomonas tetramitiformis]